MNRLPLHPFLFAVFAIVCFYGTNTVFCVPSVLIFPIFIAIGLVGLLLLIFVLATRNITVASFMTSVIVLLFFSFHFAYESVRNAQMLLLYSFQVTKSIPIQEWQFLISWVLFGILAVFACWRNRRYLENKLGLTNTIAACCLLVSTVDVVYKEIVRRQPIPQVVQAVQNPVKILRLDKNSTPDIYYIILDGCARFDVLQDLYHYDNSKFREYLKDKGFYLATDSHSNYQMTPLSLGSTMNMNYVNEASRLLPEKSNDWLPMIELIENNLVARNLKSLGYQYILFKSDWAVTQESPLADKVICCGSNDVFVNRFLGTTVWPFIEDQVHVLRREAHDHWLKVFDKAGHLEEFSSPKFVFVHFLLPHPPYLFNAEGQPSNTGPLVMHLEDFADRHAYVEQVKFTEAKIEKLVDQILATSKTKPIIILQADHGPASLDFSEGIENPTKEFLKERMSIFNAYYFPDGDYAQLYPSITPVNSFRVLFNKSFNAGLALLEDKSYFSNYLRPYKFLDVTKELNN